MSYPHYVFMCLLKYLLLIFWFKESCMKVVKFFLNYSESTYWTVNIFVRSEDACVYVNPHFLDMKLTATEEEDLRRRWQCAMGPRYEVTVRVCVVKLGIKIKSTARFSECLLEFFFALQVCQLERFGETSGLGISLEARAGHHYVCSILPEGPVGQSGKIFTEDQILEVTNWC